MQKLLYTEEGLQIIKSKNDSPTRTQAGSEPSCPLQQMRTSQLSRKCNRLRVKTLKNTFNIADPEKLLQVLPFTKLQNKIQVPKVLSMDNLITSPKQDVLELASSQIHNYNTSDRNSISRHHQQSIRLRTGDWFQWKNISMTPQVVQDFQKKLKFNEQNEEEIRMRAEKKTVQHMFQMQKVDYVEKKTKENLEKLLDQKNNNYNMDLDEFWKEIKSSTEYFDKHAREQLKSRDGLNQRLEKCKKKFAVKRCYVPQYQKLKQVTEKYYDV
ncbi:hypothetical protein pb186bvf_016553 [Paramecium bursaria]